jgi:phosphopantothenoylcysteine decarboxylase/phosphopantothenate--cysteine ligase
MEPRPETKKGNDTADNGNRPCECLVLAVTGSVGAMHVPDQLRYLQATFARTIHVIMSGAATHFVSANALRLLSCNPVLIDQFAEDSPFAVPHIQLCERAQLLLVMPATANILAKAAHGICDDLVSTTVLTFGERVVFVPNMNGVMWQNALVQENVHKLVSLGRSVIEPTTGIEIATKEPGIGGMPPIEAITEYLKELLTEFYPSACLPGELPGSDGRVAAQCEAGLAS